MILIIIGAVFALGAHGAPTSAVEDNCSIADNYLGLSCAQRGIEFFEKAKSMETKTWSDFNQLKKPCTDIDYCVRAISHCTAFKVGNVEGGFKLIKSLCSAIEFGSNTFFECEEKMKERKSDCYEKWNFFDKSDEFSAATDIEEKCRNFFGEDQCVKKAITETCGEEDWKKLRNFVQIYNDGLKQCNFEDEN